MPHMRVDLATAFSFEALKAIVARTEVDISFWGVRYVVTKRHEVICPLDRLTGRVIELFESRKKNPFSKEECEAGILLKEKIDYFYWKTDAKIKGKNLLTRLFFAIREYWICNMWNADYAHRVDWCLEDCGEDLKEHLEEDLKRV